jgi:hypothetical protein
MTKAPAETGKSSSDTAPPEPAEKTAIDKAINRVIDRKPRVTVKFTQGSGNKVDLEGGGHSDRDGWLTRLVDAFATRGTDFAVSQLNQIMAACRDSDGKIDPTRVNAMLAMIEAAAPENELQAALAVQMAITHYAATTLIMRTMRVDQISQFDAAGNMAIKLARTFALQAETLGKLQRRGEQIVKVVHVHPGAQAIVGNVSAAATGAIGPGGGGTDETRNQPHAKVIAAASPATVLPALWSQNPEREPVPVTRREE